MLLSIVLPCYRSASMIQSLVESIENEIEKMPQYDYEIILVNDSSPDHTWSAIANLANTSDKIKAIDLSRNVGQHAALMAGYRFAKGDIIVNMDADGQNPPDQIHLLLDKLAEGFDIVIAKYPRKKEAFLRRVGSAINERMARYLLRKPKNLEINSFYCMRRFVVEEILRYKGPFPYLAGLLLRATSHIANVIVTHQERMEGKSGYTVSKLLSLWFNGFTAFSVKPFRIATLIGFVFSAMGFIYGIYIIIHRLVDSSVQMGYSSLMAAIVFTGGVLMLMLGLVGEYIGRIYISLNNAPQYVIRETIGCENCEENMQMAAYQ